MMLTLIIVLQTCHVKLMCLILQLKMPNTFNYVLFCHPQLLVCMFNYTYLFYEHQYLHSLLVAIQIVSSSVCDFMQISVLLKMSLYHCTSMCVEIVFLQFRSFFKFTSIQIIVTSLVTKPMLKGYVLSSNCYCFTDFIKMIDSFLWMSVCGERLNCFCTLTQYVLL